MIEKELYDGLSFKSDLEKLSIDEISTCIEAGTWKKTNPFKHAEAIQVIRRFNKIREERNYIEASSREERKISISERALSMSSEANLIAKKALAISMSSSESAEISASSTRSQAKSARRANIIAIIAIIIAILSIAIQIYDKFHISTTPSMTKNTEQSHSH